MIWGATWYNPCRNPRIVLNMKLGDFQRERLRGCAEIVGAGQSPPGETPCGVKDRAAIAGDMDIIPKGLSDMGR